MNPQLLQLIALDKAYFKVINQEWASDLLNRVSASLGYLWLPLILFMLVLIPIIWIRRLDSVQIVAACLLSLAVSDLISAKVLAPIVLRDRPQFSTTGVQLRSLSISTPSFPDRSAARTFAVTTVLFFVASWAGLFAMVFSFLLGFSQIYIGIHFPGDILGGWIIGLIVGGLFGNFLVPPGDEYVGKQKIPKNPFDMRHKVGDQKVYNIDG